MQIRNAIVDMLRRMLAIGAGQYLLLPDVQGMDDELTALGFVHTEQGWSIMRDAAIKLVQESAGDVRRADEVKTLWQLQNELMKPDQDERARKL